MLELRAEPPVPAARCAIWERFLPADARDGTLAIAAVAARFAASRWRRAYHAPAPACAAAPPPSTPPTSTRLPRAEFPLPGPAEHHQIWEGTLPAAPQRAAGVEISVLVGFAATGGKIRNAVDTAVLLAAAKGCRVGMGASSRAPSGASCASSGRLVDAAGFGPWRDAVLRHAGVAR